MNLLFLLVAAMGTNLVEIDFRATPVIPVAEFYGKVADKPVIVPTDLPQGEITVSSGRQMASAEALALLDAALESNGFKMRCQSNFCEVMLLSNYIAQPTKQISAKRYVDYYRLRHAQPDSVRALLGTNATVEIQIDARQRMLILHGGKQALLNARARLFEIDQPLKGVTVEAIIVEVDCATNSITGVDLFQRVLKSSVGAIAGGSQSSQGGPVPVNLLSVSPTPANVAANGTFWLTLKGLKLDALLRLVDSDRHFEVLSKPVLTVLDGEQADLSIGEQRPYITQALSTSFGVQAVSTQGLNQVVGSTVAYIDLSLGLRVKPKIGEDGLIELQIVQEANEFGGDVELPTGPVPIVTKRTIRTVAQARNGEVILLGGLIRSEKNRASEGLPHVRKIPIVGKAFGEQTRRTSKTELLVFLRATIQE